jgi:hypothetical protein
MDRQWDCGDCWVEVGNEASRAYSLLLDASQGGSVDEFSAGCLINAASAEAYNIAMRNAAASLSRRSNMNSRYATDTLTPKVAPQADLFLGSLFFL